MGAFQKPIGSQEIPQGSPYVETYKNGRNEWDDRIGDAVTLAKQWRTAALLSSAVSLLSLGAIVHLADTRDNRPIVVVARAPSGDVVAAARGSDDTKYTEADIASSLKHWVIDARTVYTDADALRTNINDGYRLTEAGSPAKLALDASFQAKDPFVRAKTETVGLSKLTALPTSGKPDPQGLRTWTLTWSETTTARDDKAGRTVPWKVSITFRFGTPKTSEDVMENPDGIFVHDFFWTSV